MSPRSIHRCLKALLISALYNNTPRIIFLIFLKHMVSRRVLQSKIRVYIFTLMNSIIYRETRLSAEVHYCMTVIRVLLFPSH